MLAIAVMIIGDVPIYNYFSMSKYDFGYITTLLLTVLLVITARTIHIQHDQIEYLKFKLMCINDERKEHSSSNKHK